MKHGAGVIVIRKDGTVLMQHRDNKPGIFYPDHWAYPAGSVDEGEDYKHAAVRELEEETNYKPEETFALPEQEYTRSDGETVRRHIFWTIYDGKQEIKCNEGTEMKFLHIDELKDKKLLPGQKELIELAVEQAKSQGKL